MSKKLLRNTKKLKTDAMIRAQQVDFALKNYPFEEISPDIHLKINPRAKRMALRIDPKRRVVKLVIPKNMAIKDAYLFAHEHQHWIRQKLEELPDKIYLDNGRKLNILGQKRVILINYNPQYKGTKISLTADSLKIQTNKEDPSRRIRRFLINLAKEEITALSHKKAALIGKTVQKVEIKDTISRWGSCSIDGKLSYSWRLIFAPLDALDYVVAHEVAHLNHMDHSTAFWQVCKDLSQNYSSGKDWMKQNGSDLLRYE